MLFRAFSCFLVTILACLNSKANADVVCFDLRSTGTAGWYLNQGLDQTGGGITISATTTPGGSVFNSDANGAGVTGDVNNQVDDGETITFTFNFVSQISNLYLVSADLLNQDGDAFSGDVATVIGAGFNQTLSDGAPDYSGGATDVWAPAAGAINFANGGTLSFTTDSPDTAGYSIQELCFETGVIGAIPEPSSLAFLGLGGIGYGLRRRRNR